MTQTNGIPQLQFRRVNPFQGLMIDAGVWLDAHEYHRNQMRLHHLSLHGWGIIQGLELETSDNNTVIIQPGVAIDSSGNFVIVNQPTPFRIDTREAGTLYLILQFREVLTGPTQLGIEGAGPPTRIAEVYQIQQRDRAPEEPVIELARIDFDPRGENVKLPGNPDHPGRNELDLRHRPRIGGAAAPTSALLLMTANEPEAQTDGSVGVSAPQPPPERTAPHEPEIVVPAVAPQAPAGVAAPPAARLTVALARHVGSGWEQHRDGLGYLARELASSGFSVASPVTVTPAESDGVDILYLSGQSHVDLGEADLAGAARLLSRGGLLLGEGCAAGPSGEVGAREFALSFVDLAQRLGRQLTDVQRGHALMTSRYVFGVLPTGGRERARVLESNGIVYSDADYGCAWQGGPTDRPLTRGVIRDSLEFGINIATVRSPGG